MRTSIPGPFILQFAFVLGSLIKKEIIWNDFNKSFALPFKRIGF